MSKLNNHGQVNIPLLALLAVLGIIAYLLITQSFTFKNRLLNALYYKTPSQAFESIQIPPQDESKPPTTSSVQNWDIPNPLSDWQNNSACNFTTSDNTLNTTCTEGTLLTKLAWNSNSSIIINGSFMAKEETSSDYQAAVGLYNPATSAPIAQITAQSPASASEQDLLVDNYQPGSTQKFRLVYSKIKDERFVFYYLGDNPEPIKKAQITPGTKLNIFLSCKGTCTFGPLTVSGVKIN